MGVSETCLVDQYQPFTQTKKSMVNFTFFFFFWKKYDQSTDLKIIVYVTNNWIYVVDVRASPMHQPFD